MQVLGDALRLLARQRLFCLQNQDATSCNQRQTQNAKHKALQSPLVEVEIRGVHSNNQNRKTDLGGKAGDSEKN